MPHAILLATCSNTSLISGVSYRDGTLSGGSALAPPFPSPSLTKILKAPPFLHRQMPGFQKFLLVDAQNGDSTRRAGESDGSSSLVNALADTAKFGWALECVLSRAFQLPPEDASALVFGEDDDTPVRAPELTPAAPEATKMALLPLIDSINHYSRIPTHMYWEADGALSLSGGVD